MEHNFRSGALRWGHNFHMSPDNGEYRGWTISTPIVKVGDTLVWQTEYGEAVAEVVESNPFGDPPDMSAVRAKIVERRVRESVLKEAEQNGDGAPPWEYTLLKENQ